MNICVYGASSGHIAKVYHDSAYSLGEQIAKRNHKLVYGAGANGVMGATARGAYDNGGVIIGVAPSFFTVDGMLFDHCTELIRTETMRERKKVLEDKSDAFIVAPGGLGTFDELFEILTLKQLGRHNKPVCFFNTDGFYNTLIDLLGKMADNHFMKHKSLELFESFDDVAKMLEYIENYDDKPMDIAELKSIG